MAKTDLLTGDVRALTLKIAAPSVAAMLAASVCPLLEALVLSARDASLSAAVGASLALILLEQTVGFTLGMGAGSFVSRCIGQGRREAARRAASTAFFAALGLSALLLAAGLLFAAPVLRLLGAPESAVAAGLPYARAVFVSGPPLCGALVLSSLLRAQGKTLPNMAAALVGSALGAALLLLLCGRMGLGASGAGVAMLAREAATLAVLLAYTLRHGELIRPSLRRVRLTRAVFSEIMRSGLPTLLRQGATSVSAALLSRVRRARSGGHGALRPRDHAVHLGRHRLRSGLSAGLRRGLRRKANGALSGSLSLLSARRDCVFAGGRSGLLRPCPGAGRPFRAGRAGRRGCAPRASPAKRRLSRAERRHFDDHAHAGHGAHPPRLARRHQPTGALLSPPAGGFAAPLRPLGAPRLPERQRFCRARLFARADAGA